MNNSIKATLFTAKYSDEKMSRTDYGAVKKLYKDNDTLEDFNAAIIFKSKSNKIDVIIRTEELTRIDSWVGSIIGLSISIVILFLVLPGYYSLDPIAKSIFAIVGVIIGTLIGTLFGAIIGHVNSGVYPKAVRSLAADLKVEEYGLIVIGTDELSENIQEIIKTEPLK